MKLFLENILGATSIEYALVAGLIAIAILAGVTNLGSNVKSLWELVSGKLP